MAYDPVTLKMMWDRLIAVVDEADTALGRMAFSTVVREAHDYVTVLLDDTGRSIAQCTYSIPSFIGTLPTTARHILERIPADTLRPGDVVITNDPWLGTGHLPDITMLSPIFHQGRLIAFAGNVAHMPDIGGRAFSADAREVFEEGLRLPPMFLYRGGEPAQELFSIIRHNVRVPEQVLGDLEAGRSANEVMARRLEGFLTDYGLTDLRELGEEMFSRSEANMRAKISELPDGEYCDSLIMDGFDEPLKINTRIVIKGDQILVDYAGSSPQIDRAMNSVHNYTYAYTVYPLKCILDPETPNNEGSFRPLEITAPEGSFLNPRLPAAVNGRHLVGHLLSFAIYGALRNIIPEKILADGGCAPSWVLVLNGQHDTGRPFSSFMFFAGGQGARRGMDGPASLHFPTNISSVPAEHMEATCPVRIEFREQIPDSGGGGQWRGGNGVRIILRSLATRPCAVTLQCERIQHPPQGLFGGQAGSPGRAILNGEPIAKPKEQFILQPNDVLMLDLPGGAGYGDPLLRAPDAVLDDVRAGVITAASAKKVFGVALSPDGRQLDAKATERHRAATAQA
ncbi:hydantoinase B/oxoprolinase family protein [Castellaniella sp.]|uniref:hydantoinase B/oxoprolinase family protein n=1 Tax=Castellaniella sp. TaxID=1955812 RepID=UPI003561FD2B